MLQEYITELFRFEDLRDASDAKHEMDKRKIAGRYIDVQFAVGDRKSKLYIVIKFSL